MMRKYEVTIVAHQKTYSNMTVSTHTVIAMNAGQACVLAEQATRMKYPTADVYFASELTVIGDLIP